MIVLCPMFRPILLVSLAVGCLPMARAASPEEVWDSNSNVLQFTRPAAAEIHYPWLDQIRGIMLRSLNSADQAREMATLHAARGNKSQSSYAKYIGPLKITNPAENGLAVRQAMMKSMRLYAQKETKGDVFPQSWKDGLRFRIGGGGGGPAPDIKGFVYNGNPELRYGLRLTSIEPSVESLKLASNGMDDYEIIAQAPKARVIYSIGEVYPDAYARSFPANITPDFVAQPTFWQTIPASIPDFKFSGRMAPRGLPGPGSPLPPQSIFLDQTQGYYQVEAQMSGNFRQENVLHRFRLPVYGSMNYRQERNKDWKFTKSTFENIYSDGQGFAVNLERYHLEKRYQLGFQFHRLINHFELYAHVPDAALEGDHFWHQHRWETRFDFHF